jgi:hypothetical protein
VLRAAYITSVALLAGLALVTLASPVLLPVLRGQAQEAAPLSDAGKIKIIAQTDEWIVQYDLMNHGPEASLYSFEVSSTSPLHTSTAFVDRGKGFVFIYHIYPREVPSGSVRLTVRRGAEIEPLDDVTLHLASAGPAAPATSWWTQLRARFASGARQ